ncbi:MAG: cytochrome b6 [Pseudomonadota bacterium]
MSTLLERFVAFVEDRTGLLSALRGIGRTPAPPSARLRLGIGGLVGTLLLVVIGSGVGLAWHYAPSTTHAWASVAYLERELPWGRFTRALHYQGTNALIVGLALQLFLAALQGAYRRPREFGWWLSLGLIGLVTLEAMTGALLPWDEQGYWASRVETGIMASAPVVGRLWQHLAQGGNDFGHLMLTRYSTLHTVVLPALVTVVVAMQLLSLRRQGAAPSAGQSNDSHPFAPAGLFAVAVGAFVGAVAVTALAVKLGAPLEGPADPSGGYPPRPAWYFRALYELRRHFEGPLEPVATMLLPGLAGGLLAALPLLDAGTNDRRRRLVASALGIGLVLAGVSTVFGMRRDAKDPKYLSMLEDSAKKRDKALKLAAGGVPPEGPLLMLRNTPEERGRKLFSQNCAGCHPTGQPRDKPKGPDLAGWGGAAWAAGCIAHPGDQRFFGATPITGMEDYASLGETRIHELAAFVAGLKAHPGVAPDQLPAGLQSGRAAFEAEGCDGCHSLTAGEENAAPNLNGYASASWLRDLLLAPDGALFFGDENDMPSYAGKLDDRQLDDLTAFMDILAAKDPARPAGARETP